MFNIQSYFVTLCENQRKMGRNSVKPGAVRRENVSGSWHRCRQPLLLPLLWTMKIKTFEAMVVEKPHFWLTNYQILIVLQFPHICKHTRKQTYCMRVVFPFSNSPLTLVWEGAVSPILNCMGVYDKIFPITKYDRGWSKMWCLKVKAQICHVCHDYSNYTFMVLALENRENKFFAQHFWQKCVSS